jgi:hypothetical protein
MERNIRVINPTALLQGFRDKNKDRPLVSIDRKDFELRAFEVLPLEGYEMPINEKSGKKFPYCCKYHENVFSEATKWYKKFPNCCEPHKKLLDAFWFKKEDYSFAPDKIVRQLSYTTTHIERQIELADWYKDITDYIRASIDSFGQLPEGYGGAVGLHIYLSYLKAWLKDETRKLPKIKLKKLSAYLESRDETDENKETDLNILISTYQKWLKAFPFQIIYFNKLKPAFERQIPILKSKPITNRYLGVSSAELRTKAELIELLIEITNELLQKINTSEWVDKKLIPDVTKHRLGLLNESHRIKQSSLLEEFVDNETKYISTLKEWLENEKGYFKDISELLSPNAIQQIESKSKQLEAKLIAYGFHELPLVRTLTKESKEKLAQMISASLPYAIAMLDHLGFLTRLKEQYFTSTYKLNREVAKWFDSDKEGRAVKGNINVLSSASKDNRSKYTSHLHKEQVKRDYQNLK